MKKHTNILGVNEMIKKYFPKNGINFGEFDCASFHDKN
jgi:hypothetical protein